MSDLTNEQIRAILDGAPDGATHCCYGSMSVDYIKIEGFHCKFWNDLEVWSYPISNTADVFIESNPQPLYLLKEILALRERVTEMEPLWHKDSEAPPKNVKVIVEAGFDSDGENKFICSHNGLGWETDRLVTGWCEIPKGASDE